MMRAWTVLAPALLLIGLLHGQEAPPPANDDISRPTPVTLDSKIDAAIAVDAYSSGIDQYFALDLAGADAEARFDVVLAAGPQDHVELDLLDDKGGQLVYVSGDGAQRFKGFVLGAGRHFFRVRGSWDKDKGEPPPHFVLSFERKGQWQAGEEREPNGDFASASVVPIEQAAKGELIDTDDRDHFAFDVKGAARLWTIVATGPAASGLVLYDGAGNELKRVTRDPATNDSQMWSVLLPPGRTHFSILSGVAGAWQVQATATGPAPIEALGGAAPARRSGEIDEVEPDNTAGTALVLPLGGSRAGQIESSDDSDIYRFSLEAETRVKLTLKGATDGLRLRARMTRGENGNFSVADLAVESAAAGEASETLMLAQGDYYVGVRGDRREAKPYQIGLERLPYFGGPADVEPNDSIWTASPVPPSLVLDGTMTQDDADWYRLPKLGQPTKLTLTLEETTKGLQPRLTIIAATPHADGPVTLDDVGGAPDFTADPDGKTFTADLPAGDGYALRLNYGEPGPYRVRLAFAAGPVAVAAADTLKTSLAIAAPGIAAFAKDHQKVAVKVSVANSGAAAVDAALAFHPGDDRWAVEGAPATLHIEPGQTAAADVMLVAPPLVFDGAATMLSVEARAGGAAGAAEGLVTARLDAPPVAPEHRFELPDSLLGGIDVAWSAFGATVPQGREPAIDGFATLGTAERVSPSDEAGDVITVTLPGDAPQTLLGFTINPTIGPDIADQIKTVAVEASTDGTTFTRVFEGPVASRQREYAHVFTAPVSAKYLRVLPLGAVGDNYGTATFGEFKAIADAAAAKALAPEGFNIADPKFGGYLVSAHPKGFRAQQFLDADDGSDAAYLGESDERLLDWTVSFRNERAARLTRITWQDVSDFSADQAIPAVEIETALELNGPWTKAGTWTLDRSAGPPPPFTFAQPVWARFVRFAVPLSPFDKDEPTHYHRGPRQIQIFEAPPDAGGGTIMGEWGDTTREGPYERATPAVVTADTADHGGGATEGQPRILTPDAAAEGRVSAETGSQWWAVDVPDGGQTLTVTLTGHPALGIAASVSDAAGQTIPITVAQDDGHIRILTGKVAAGRYLVHVEEPPRSIAVVWDTSGSVSPYISTIMQSVRGFVRYVVPGRDEVQLLAFDDPEARPLMADWTGDPVTAFGALNAYDWKANSSNGEGGIIGAAHALQNRPGTRAMIVITDFQTGGGYDQRNEALDLVKQTGSRVFTVAIPSDSQAPDAAIERGLMRAFASVSNGAGTYAGTPAELEQTFARTAATLRAPKDYTILASIGFKPPEPGHVEVIAPPVTETSKPPPVSKDRAVLVIFDASGSMLKKFGKSTRIQVAKDTLTNLTQTMLPEGTPFAMRVFGDTKKGSCDTNLRLPLGPLDRAAAKTVVDKLVSINGAKTAIGASLNAAAQDLAQAKGQKLIVIITDGEETCEGDPLKEIEALRASGIEARVSIVGFAVDDQALKDTFSIWAAAGGGGYFDASRPELIGPAVQAALAPTYEIRSPEGQMVAAGVVGAGPVEVPPGTYTLHIFVDPPEDRPIVVESGGTVRVTMGQ